jgi:hypothetical protein
VGRPHRDPPRRAFRRRFLRGIGRVGAKVVARSLNRDPFRDLRARGGDTCQGQVWTRLR